MALSASHARKKDMNQKTAKSVREHTKLAAAYRGVPFTKNLYRRIKKLYSQTPRNLRHRFWELLDKKYGQEKSHT